MDIRFDGRADFHDLHRRFHFPRERQFHRESRSLAELARHFDGTAVLANDAICHREPESGAFFRSLGSEEWVIDAREVFRRNARAGVGNFYVQQVARRTGANRQNAP